LTDLAAAAVEIEKTAAAGGLAEFDQLKPALKECGFCHRDSGFRDK
jgi:cytochrome c553